MDDAQRRAKDFNVDQRIAELEAEVARLRRALKQQRAEDEVRALVRGLKALTAGRITVTKLPNKKAPKAQRDVVEYVNALADDAAAHPEKLGDVGQLVEGDDALLSTPKRKPTKERAPKKWVSPLGQSVREAIAERMRYPEYRAAAEAAAKKKAAKKTKRGGR
jgi:hypothetical protein